MVVYTYNHCLIEGCKYATPMCMDKEERTLSWNIDARANGN